MQHLDEGTIHAWLDGALPDAEAARVERHAAECAECAPLVAEARGLVAGASRIMSALDDVQAVVPREVGSGRRDAAPAFRPAQGAPAPLPSRRHFWSRPGTLAAAASVVVMVGTAVVVTRSGGPVSRAVVEAPSMAQTGQFSADTTAGSAGTTAASPPAVGGADAAGGTATVPVSGRPTAGRRGAAVGAAERREGRAGDGAAKRAVPGRGVAGALRDSAAPQLESQSVAANRGFEPSAAAQRRAAPMERIIPTPAPAPAAARPLERVDAAARPDSSAAADAARRVLAPTVLNEAVVPSRRAAAARARSERPVPTTGAEVRSDTVEARSDTVAVARVDTVTVEPPASPSYRPRGRAAAATRTFAVTGCYEVLEGGLPRFITLKTNSVWSGAAEHAFVATAEGAIGYWSQPRTGAVHLVIAGAVVTARIDASTGELRGTAHWGRRNEKFLARRGCK